jgi:hypothetical protein
MAMRRPRKPPRPTGGKPPKLGGYPPRPGTSKTPTRKGPKGFTGKGRKLAGLGYHGNPNGATTPAKGAGYHGKPPAGMKKGKVVKSPGGKPPVYRKKRVGKLPMRTVKAPRGARRGR